MNAMQGRVECPAQTNTFIVMQVASKITCWNRAGFDLKYQVKWKDGDKTCEGGWSDYYPNPQSDSFDLDSFNISDGAEVWIEVDACLGKTKESSGKVNYKKGCGKTANYSVTGATLTFDIKLAPDTEVSKIKCINHGGFKMKFCVKWNGGESGYSEYFFNPKSKTFDLDTLNISDGSEAWIYVDILWGGSGTANEHVVYKKGCGNVATYEVMGTTYHLTINRIG